MRHIMRALIVCACLAPAEAGAGALDRLLSPWSLSSPYVGIGYALTHHTGYAPVAPGEVEAWTFGGKAFAGLRLNAMLSAELTYIHFGNARLKTPEGKENGHAVALSLVASQPLSELRWFSAPGFQNVSFFVKAGPAFRRVNQKMTGRPDVSDQGLTYAIGAGLQYDFAEGLFLRGEYEYFGKLRSDTTINAQHTPLSISIGFRF